MSNTEAYTPDQERAVFARNTALLVSAAAGSGKTKVLTGRLLQQVKEGKNIDRFLVITFTRNAAAELRSRILEGLTKLAAEHPEDSHLQEQTMRLYRTPIGTIHSYCSQLVRENAYSLGLAPDFAVVDDERSSAMLATALDTVMENLYTRPDRERFLCLVDTVGAGRDDKKLSALIERLYTVMQSQPFPKRWVRERLAMLDIPDDARPEDTVWGRYILDELAEKTEYYAQTLEEAIPPMKADAAIYKAYAGAFAEEAAALRDFARACREGWNRAGEKYTPLFKDRLPPARKAEDEELKKRVQEIRSRAKEACKGFASYFDTEPDILLAEIRESKPMLQALADLTLTLDDEYAKLKRVARVCDFSDLEHYAIQLFCDDNGDPTPLVESFGRRFVEVMVDEYQDVSDVQNRLFQYLSDGGKNLFFVGDIKQSIYRFRQANPGIFLAREEEYSAPNPPSPAEVVRLKKNFRSRPGVIDAVNAVFSTVMSRVCGDVDYNENAALHCGGTFPGEGVATELYVLSDEETEEGETEGENPGSILREARFVAAKIVELLRAGASVTTDEGTLRPVRPGDIAILLRSTKNTAALYRRALTEAGLSVSSGKGGEFFDFPETAFVLSMLQVLDNPRRDIPLLAALRAFPLGFTPDELAAARSRGGGDFWSALTVYARENTKAAEFVTLVTDLRDFAREAPAEAVLRALYTRVSLPELCRALPDGEMRRANLMHLFTLAQRFEENGYRGLFRFVRWLERLKQKGEEPPVCVNGGAVRLMSIHQSKGLEFPVVFLADCGRQFHGPDADFVLSHETLGFGAKVFDSENSCSYPSLAYRAVREKNRTEELSEQMRVLYVGMTRAKDRLILTGHMKNPEKYRASTEFNLTKPIPPRAAMEARDYLHWLLPVAWLHPDIIRCETVTDSPRAESPAAPAVEGSVCEPEAEEMEALARSLRWRYGYESSVSLPSKLTATGLVSLTAAQDPEAFDLTERGRDRVYRFAAPSFGGEEKSLTAAEKGVATHRVLQYIDFSQTENESRLAAELERLCREGYISETQRKAVEPAELLAFFQASVGRRALRAKSVRREFRFSLLCPADKWFGGVNGEEEILLQGVIDLLLEEKDGLVIVDFKTDARVEPERHRPQLQAYAYAAERIFQKPVKEAVLWYIRKKEEKTLAFPEKMC